jgi:hypothetical protein
MIVKLWSSGKVVEETGRNIFEFLETPKEQHKNSQLMYSASRTTSVSATVHTD